jgi:hypothetical protein
MTRAVAVLLLSLVLPSEARAWGFEPHRFIMDRAIALLPPELRPLFEKHRAMAVERAIDPDTWRTAGFDEEPKNHFVDLDWEGFGKYPFRELPRDYTAAVAKFGRERIEEMGTLPWRVEEFHGNLRRAFEAYPRRGAFGQFDIIFFSATLAHYVSDAHVPFHGVINYDGQLTNQHGIHGRFETALFERYRDRLTIAPTPQAPLVNPRDFVFDRLLRRRRRRHRRRVGSGRAPGGPGGSAGHAAAPPTQLDDAGARGRATPTGRTGTAFALLRRQEGPMLWTLIVLLLLFWLLGFAFDVAGGIVHVLLVIALVLFLVNLISGRRTVV